MKRLLIFMSVLGFLWACSGPKNIENTEKAEPEDVNLNTKDSVSYVMETFDAKFEKWYNLHKNPASFQKQEFYEKWNRKYVSEWNKKSQLKENSDFFVPIVGYDRKKDYGFAMNHQLFYYFQYVEKVLKIEILPEGPNVVSE
mgnify:CR=1 FL=1